MKQATTFNFRFTLALLLTIFMLAACQQSATQNSPTIEICDMLGRKVQVPEKVERVVGLRAGALRLLTYMDATNLIVGVEEGEIQYPKPYTNAHCGLKKLPSIGPIMGGDAEMILSVKPDVIFISYTTIGDADALQKKTGVPVLAIDLTEIATAADTLFASIRLIGKVLNRSGRADSLINYIKNSIEELNERTRPIPFDEKPSVYVGGISYSGAHGLRSTHAYFPPFVFVNANNVASAISKKLVSHVKGTFIDTEQLLVWNPDLIFIDQAGMEMVQNDWQTGWYDNLNAKQRENVFTLLPYNNYATNYELVLMNAWITGKIIYPEYFADIDLNEKNNEISQWFLKSDFQSLFNTK